MELNLHGGSGLVGALGNNSIDIKATIVCLDKVCAKQDTYRSGNVQRASGPLFIMSVSVETP